MNFEFYLVLRKSWNMNNMGVSASKGRSGVVSNPSPSPSPSPSMSLLPPLPFALPALPAPTPTPTPRTIYDPSYNLSLFGFERFHPFDAHKFARIHRALGRPRCLAPPVPPVPDRRLEHDPTCRRVHTESYLLGIRSRAGSVAEVLEMGVVGALPMFLVRRNIVRPLRRMAYGTGKR